MSVRDLCTGDAATVPAELRGYRMWRRQGRFLTATNTCHGEWIRPELTATCRAGGLARDNPFHRPPVEDCGCGIYGWYRPDDTRLHNGSTFGVIAASGRVLLGDYGFRAERARILALVIYPRPSAGADPAEDVEETAAGDYWRARGVAVFDTRDELLEAFPPDDVRELLGFDPAEREAERAAEYAARYAQTLAGHRDALAAASAQLAAAMHVEAERFRRGMEQFVRALASSGTSMAELAKRAAEVDRNRRPAPFLQPALDKVAPDLQAAMRDALEQKRRGHRGPEKRRRGRARLSL